MDVALVVQSYQDIRKKLGSSVFDGRCLIFGVSTELMAQNQARFQYDKVSYAKIVFFLEKSDR